ncbi:uncharacterized protein RJT20DRAFT_2048 [Scheffersomyces xylosifermentans]|uniref:uncharacterized protein n=1 Tax=Scheffersomyces xylosifermentans TaxID=1304137 RepID=UPI00315D1845
MSSFFIITIKMIRRFSTIPRLYLPSKKNIASTIKPPKNSKIKSRFANALPLEEFLFRQRVKGIYRDLLRIVYRSHEKQDLLRFVRDEFKINGTETDLNHRRYLLNLGLKRINEMITMLGIRSAEFQ